MKQNALLILFVAGLLATTTRAAMTIKTEMNPERFTIEDRRQPVLTYNFGTVPVPAGVNGKYAVARSNYVHPLFGPNGEILTKDYSPDHPHHRGIYWAWPEVTYRGETRDLHALQGVFARPVKMLRQDGGVHDIDIAQWGLGMERSGPVEIEGRGVYPKDGLHDTILTYRIEFTYANGLKIIMTDTGQNRHGVKFIGENGWVFTRYGIEADPPSLLREKIGPDEIHLYHSPDHARNFLDCMKSRSETITPPEIAHRATSTALLGGLACQLGRKLRWNPQMEHFHGDAEAERLLSYPMRPPWSV